VITERDRIVHRLVESAHPKKRRRKRALLRLLRRRHEDTIGWCVCAVIYGCILWFSR